MNRIYHGRTNVVEIPAGKTWESPMSTIWSFDLGKASIDETVRNMERANFPTMHLC